MAHLKEALDASADYWLSRISEIVTEMPNEDALRKEESQVAESLSKAILFQLEALKTSLSDLSVMSQHTFDNIVHEVLSIDIIVSSIEVQVKDYLSMAHGANATLTTTASPPPSGSGPTLFQRFLNGLTSALGSLQQWLLNILRVATNLKDWTISGDIGAGVPGLASAKLSITFGQ